MSLYKFFTALIQKYEIVSGQSDPISDARNEGFIKAPLKYKMIFKQRPGQFEMNPSVNHLKSGISEKLSSYRQVELSSLQI